LIAALLGPNGQLGTDIQSTNAANGSPLTIVPVSRADVDIEDIDRATRLLRDMRFDVLINCSSYHKTDEIERNAQKAFTINSHLVHRLAEICAERQARFVHISTDYVFGGQEKRMPLTEEDAKAPLNVYGASKSMGENLALQAKADILILRVASLFGAAGASGKGGNFVETMLRLGRERAELKVVDDQFMSPTATADIAFAMLKLLRHGAESGIYHVVNAEEASWYQFACRIIERAGVNARVIPIKSSEYPVPAKRPPYSVLSNAKVARVIGPMRPWQEALDSYLVAKGHRTGTSPLPLPASVRNRAKSQ
jgi:dTDP-4-dehydrorhamnose reductase